jgi:hypothetical protein
MGRLQKRKMWNAVYGRELSRHTVHIEEVRIHKHETGEGQYGSGGNFRASEE